MTHCFTLSHWKKSAKSYFSSIVYLLCSISENGISGLALNFGAPPLWGPTFPYPTTYNKEIQGELNPESKSYLRCQYLPVPCLSFHLGNK